jgi:CRISPR/Cas system-associated exonuclease Cas4 (RecB family)
MMHSRLNLASALKARQVLANSEENVLFRCIVPETGYIGLPDIADCRNGKQPVLVETKTTGRLPMEPWMDNRIQMGVYLIGLERLSYHPEHGIVEYRLRTDSSVRERFEIHLDTNLRQTIQETTEAVLGLLKGKEPVPCNNPRKCASCAYRDSCPWSLLARAKLQGPRILTCGKCGAPTTRDLTPFEMETLIRDRFVIVDSPPGQTPESTLEYSGPAQTSYEFLESSIS